jgi:SAM-dependent methyltransferase
MIRRLRSALRRRLSRDERAARTAYEFDFARASEEAVRLGMEIFRYPVFESGEHPEGYIDFECRFAAWHLRSEAPRRVLDVGSYRHFVIGLSALCEVTALDVRPRRPGLGTEAVMIGDARSIPALDGAFDAVVTLSSIEHFGLGRYGDAMDLDADRAAAAEMRRVLRPGGLLVVTTTLTRGRPTLAFNAHRIYDLAGARALFPAMEPVDERFYSHGRAAEVALEEVAHAPGDWDVYCACWRKPG